MVPFCDHMWPGVSRYDYRYGHSLLKSLKNLNFNIKNMLSKINFSHFVVTLLCHISAHATGLFTLPTFHFSAFPLCNSKQTLKCCIKRAIWFNSPCTKNHLFYSPWLHSFFFLSCSSFLLFLRGLLLWFSFWRGRNVGSGTKELNCYSSSHLPWNGHEKLWPIL